MHSSNFVLAIVAVTVGFVSGIPASLDPTSSISDEEFYNAELPEFTADGTPIIDLRNVSTISDSHLAKRADCQNSPGVANGACVKWYTNGNSKCGYNINGQYKPTCAGNCFVVAFDSVSVGGDGTYGTRCQFYNDYTCGNYIGQSANVIVGPGECSSKKGYSMKCWYRC